MAEGLAKSILELEDIQKIQPDLSQLKIINRETCEKIQVIIFAKEKNTIKLITTNNFPEQLQKLLAKLEEKGYRYELSYTSPEGFAEAMKWYEQLQNIEARQEQDLKEQKQAAGKWAIAMIQKLFEKRNDMEPGDFILEMVRLAFQTGASDLHFQPEQGWILMKVRRDGVLQEIEKFTHEEFKKYIQKLKFIAGTKMNIDYVPQDWRFSFEAVDVNWQKRQVDVRINFMPWIQTESTVMRFLDPTKGISTFEKIGFTPRVYEILKRNLEKNTGITIMTWPTWSWKTTTLYTILNYLNDWAKKIITLEDPVEYQLPGIQQSQINYSKWYDYPLGLKAILRHDPEIILVWETRDGETAETSINAALTGHVVFTTLHTNSAIESITRILNMWVKPFMLAPSLNLIVAQRLVRKVCPFCASKRDANYFEKSEIEDTIKKINDVQPTLKLTFDGKVMQPVWCEKCNGSGYLWRIALIEAFEINDDIKKMIIEGRTWIDMYAKARENWYLTMKEDGILKLLDGLTTIDEIRRVV